MTFCFLSCLSHSHPLQLLRNHPSGTEVSIHLKSSPSGCNRRMRHISRKHGLRILNTLYADSAFDDVLTACKTQPWTIICRVLVANPDDPLPCREVDVFCDWSKVRRNQTNMIYSCLRDSVHASVWNVLLVCLLRVCVYF